MDNTVERSKPRGPGKKVKGSRRQFSKSFKLQVVKMGVEDGLPVGIICKECDIDHSTYYRWVRKYRTGGEGALAFRSSRSGESPNYPQVSQAIVTVKKEHPEFGIRRIVSALHRWFFLPASNEMVRKTVVNEGLQTPAPRKRRYNVEKPRRFERSTPNQLWQSDIMMFRMGGRQVYLIGYIDDYSRYITGIRLCMAQTAENVIELYRKATAEYSVPKEMLTDNGRQYVNWRGVSKFQKELQKDRVKHIRSAPHHPMTLGKIERFWQAIYGEFLVKAQFTGFEDAQERIRLWVQYYNHKRPHQGIASLCPADRYFEVAGEVRKTIEAGIRENALELALRGKAKEPFYLVGRMEGQSVVLRTRKGRLALSVNDTLQPTGSEQEFTIDKEKEEHDGSAEGGRGTTGVDSTETQQLDVERSAACGGGAEDLVGTRYPLTNMSGNEHHLDYIEPLAAACDGGDAAGAGTGSTAGQGAGAQSASPGTDQETLGDPERETCDTVAPAGEERATAADGRLNGGYYREVSGAVGDGTQCTCGYDDGQGGRAEAGNITQELLRMAGSGAQCDARSAHRPSGGPSCESGGYGEGGTGAAGGGSLPAGGACETDDRGEDHSDRLRSAAEIALERFGKAE